MAVQHNASNAAMENEHGHVHIEHGSAATAAGPNGPTQQNHGSNATQDSTDNNPIIIHNGVLPTDAAMVPTTVAPRVLFMRSGTSTPSPAVPRRRSRSQPGAARAEQADVPASITPPVGAPRAQNSPLTAGRSVRRRAGPNDPEVDSLEEALRALREQQRHDHNALVKLDIMMADQTRALEAQRKWNEDNSRRVLAREGAIQAATVTSNHYSKEKADELKVTLEAYIPQAMGDIEAKSNRRLDKIEQFLAVLEKAKPGEDENWLNMLKFLDAEVEKLKSCPKADGAFGQSILDEAKNVIKGCASDLEQELGGQLASAAGTVAQVNAYVDNRLGAVENRLAATDAAFTALQTPLGPAVAALQAQASPARQRTAEARLDSAVASPCPSARPIIEAHAVGPWRVAPPR